MQSNAFYKIYRADLTVSGEYNYLTTIPCPASGGEVTYDDISLILYDIHSAPIGVCWNSKKYGYKVQAVDNQTKSSVLSDEGNIEGYEDPCADVAGDNPNNINGNSLKYNFYNYPNPFNPSTEIRFTLPKDELVTIKIYNLLGAEVITLLDHIFKNAGTYSVQFDGTNFASGLYLYRIETRNFIQTKKMLLLK
jgi:hypothetical protein